MAVKFPQFFFFGKCHVALNVTITREMMLKKSSINFDGIYSLDGPSNSMIHQVNYSIA